MNQTPAAPDAQLMTLRFSTDTFAPGERLTAWHEIYGKSLLKVDIEPLERDNLHTDVLVRKLPGLGVMAGSRSAAVYRRSASNIDNDDVILSINLAGDFEAHQIGRTATMARGDAVLVTGAEPGYVTMSSSGHSLSLCVPARAVAAAGPVFCRRIPADNAALRLLMRYTDILDDTDSFAVPELRRQITNHIHDLIALTVGATGDVAEAAKARGGQAARLRAVLAGIEQHLTNPVLSAVWLGVRLGLSERYVHHLLAGAGLSFSETVRNKRVERARRMLEQPSAEARRIIDIAYAVGFNDLSSFNRVFRRRFGCTPSEVLHRH
jgi:AraC-like DNA-binding protein